MKSAIILSIFGVTQIGLESKVKTTKLDKNWTTVENLFLKLEVTNIESNRRRTVTIS